MSSGETPRKERLRHLDSRGQARMVDVSQKGETVRRAIAEARVSLGDRAFAAVAEGLVPKGDVAALARIAGIQAAKETSRLIPLCHPLQLTSVSVDVTLDAPAHAVVLTATVESVGRTGVEMEALTAVTVAALTVYDTCKSITKGIVVESVRLLEKTGGKSGTYRAER